jgi:hypothetical protein
MAMVLNGGVGHFNPTNYGNKPVFLRFSGTMRTADFTGTGEVEKLGLPVGSVIFFHGTRTSGANACALVAIRQTTANGSIADWFSADGVALSTLVND